MEKKREICEYRDKLDKTLSSPELTDYETLESLLRNQLCSSPECNENILEKKTADVWKLLSKLRSVSKLTNDASSHGDWKLQYDLEDCRVMYREGLDGNPFHTMLVEGYMDAPVENCLCVSWETTLYNKWWPQFVFPPFKILQSTCLHKVGIGEQVCLVRMKVPWPLSDRELIVHYFSFEYFKEGLVVILLNTISDLDSIGVSSKDIIPESPEAVRIDLVGGFVLQKVTPQRSYFRTIGELDIKLDFVPPSLMNFVCRQLIGNGFRLYKKSVASVAKFDEDYSRALADPLYTKIRQALYSTDKLIEEEPKLEANEVNSHSLRQNERENDEDARENEPVHFKRAVPEIEEEKEEDEFEESVSSEGNVNTKTHGDIRRKFCISPEVKQALGTLDKVVPEIEEEVEDDGFEESVSSEGNVNGKTHGDIRRKFCISPEVKQALGTLDKVIYMVRNLTPVQEAKELSPNRAEDQAKQVSLLEIFEQVPQRSQRQDFSSSTTQEVSYYSQEDKRENETGQEDGVLKNGKNELRKRKIRCFAFRSWR